MYKALDVARYVISYCHRKGSVISNLKLQKILYFIQAEFLVVKETACFSDPIQAWTFGPVVPTVYREYRIFGNAPIPEIQDLDSSVIDSFDRSLIDGMVDVCAKYTASQLVDITHKQDPWINAFEPYCNNVITEDAITNFFK